MDVVKSDFVKNSCYPDIVDWITEGAQCDNLFICHEDTLSDQDYSKIASTFFQTDHIKAMITLTITWN